MHTIIPTIYPFGIDGNQKKLQTNLLYHSPFDINGKGSIPSDKEGITEAQILEKPSWLKSNAHKK